MQDYFRWVRCFLIHMSKKLTQLIHHTTDFFYRVTIKCNNPYVVYINFKTVNKKLTLLFYEWSIFPGNGSKKDVKVLLSWQINHTIWLMWKIPNALTLNFYNVINLVSINLFCSATRCRATPFWLFHPLNYMGHLT